jgi:hypothetical protein
MLRIISLTLVLVAPTYADVFSCVQPEGRTVLQSRPCKRQDVRPPRRQSATHPPEDLEFTNNKGQHCRFVPPSYVKLVCEEGFDEAQVDIRSQGTDTRAAVSRTQ